MSTDWKSYSPTEHLKQLVAAGHPRELAELKVRNMHKAKNRWRRRQERQAAKALQPSSNCPACQLKTDEKETE